MSFFVAYTSYKNEHNISGDGKWYKIFQQARNFTFIFKRYSILTLVTYTISIDWNWDSIQSELSNWIQTYILKGIGFLITFARQRNRRIYSSRLGGQVSRRRRHVYWCISSWVSITLTTLITIYVHQFART